MKTSSCSAIWACEPLRHGQTPQARPLLERSKLELAALASQSQLRRLRDCSRRANLCSNDYLGLSTDIRLQRSGCRRAGRGIAGGFHRFAPALRQRRRSGKTWKPSWREFTGAEAALYFNSGYAANVGLLSCIAAPRGRDFLRQRQSRQHHRRHTPVRRAQNNIPASRSGFSRRRVARSSQRAGKRPQKFIVVESVFSMDGDRAPLRDLLALASATARN